MIYTNNNQVGLSANEVNNLITKLIENKQDKKIIFEGQEMLLTTALQRVNNSAVGKANITVAQRLPDTLTPNTQYWVSEYNGQTLDNGCFIIMADNLGAPHHVGQSPNRPTLQDVQINGSSIIDGATHIANIQPKTVIDDTSTNNDIPSAKGVWDLVNAGGGGGLSIEDVSNKITIQPKGNLILNDYKAFKISDKFLFIKCTLTTTSDFSTSIFGTSVATISGLKNAGINNLMDIAGSCWCDRVDDNTVLLGNDIYIVISKDTTRATLRFSYLIPINV